MQSASFLPITVRDLRAELRNHRLHKCRLVAALTAGLVCAAFVCADRWAGGIPWQRVLTVVPIGGFAPCALLAIGLSRGTSLLSEERREGTLPLLLLTHLTGWDIVLGKILQALALEWTWFLATGPALVLPLVAAGFSLRELWLIVMGCANVLFFGLAVGLLTSLFTTGAKAASWALVVMAPVLVYSSPLGVFLPAGQVRAWLAAMEWMNPCAALGHVQMAAAGVRPSAYWGGLVTSHAAGWALLTVAGLLLPWTCRWQAARTVTRPRMNWRRKLWAHRRNEGRWSDRERLLNRNPFLWLAGRESGPTVQIWLLLVAPGLGWGWLAWIVCGRGMNVLVVLTVAAAISWLVSLLGAIPREASRRLVEDRHTGALELLLCTPLDEKGIVRGQWLCLSRRYLLPVLAVICLSLVLMWTGYATFGFGGMLDPEDRPRWLVSWLSGLFLLPCWLAGLCWVAMRRALLARTPAEAGGMALLQVLALPGFALWAIYWLSVWSEWNPGAWWMALLMFLAFVGAPLVCALRARQTLLATLRHAAAERYTAAGKT